MEVFEATEKHLDEAAYLFDLYRQFYKQQPNIEGVKDFLKQRFSSSDSVFFLAREASSPIGFTQLYPSFSSVAMQKMWYLNDLFVVDTHRQKGVAKKLLAHAKSFVQDNGGISLKLATAVDNFSAKALYESVGYNKVTAFDHYVLRT